MGQIDLTSGRLMMRCWGRADLPRTTPKGPLPATAPGNTVLLMSRPSYYVGVSLVGRPPLGAEERRSTKRTPWVTYVLKLCRCSWWKQGTNLVADCDWGFGPRACISSMAIVRKGVLANEGHPPCILPLPRHPK